MYHDTPLAEDAAIIGDLLTVAQSNGRSVKTMGGPQVLAGHPAVFLARGLSCGGAYLQVTQTPEALHTAEGQAQLTALREMLAPIGPEPGPTP